MYLSTPTKSYRRIPGPYGRVAIIFQNEIVHFNFGGTSCGFPSLGLVDPSTTVVLSCRLPIQQAPGEAEVASGVQRWGGSRSLRPLCRHGRKA